IPAATVAALAPFIRPLATVTPLWALVAALARFAAGWAVTGRRFVVDAQREGDSFTGDVHVENLDPDDVPRLHHIPRLLDVRPRHGRHVHQTVLVHADVHERAERGHVRHHALQQHPGTQVLQRIDPFGEGR